MRTSSALSFGVNLIVSKCTSRPMNDLQSIAAELLEIVVKLQVLADRLQKAAKKQKKPN